MRKRHAGLGDLHLGCAVIADNAGAGPLDVLGQTLGDLGGMLLGGRTARFAPRVGTICLGGTVLSTIHVINLASKSR